jgi:hypothetical protein
MGQAGYRDDDADAYQWRAPAPAARAATMALYLWRDAPLAAAIALGAALPAVIAALMAPALLSYSPAADLLAPIAEARAMASGSAPPSSVSAPFDLLLLLGGDLFFEAPGRIHLGAKAFAALIAAGLIACFASVRFSMAQAALLAAATAAFVAAPLSGPKEASFALMTAVAIAFLSAPAQETRLRAGLEGVLAGLVLVALWMSSAILALFAVAALSACPFLSGRRGFIRYAAAIVAAGLCAAFAEVTAPGAAASRAATVTEALSDAGAAATVAAFDIAAPALSAMIVLLIAAIFGGREHTRNALTASALLAIGWAAALVAGAEPVLVFPFAAALAVFSTSSPFYDGVFRAHDRASIAVSGAAALLTLGLAASIFMQSTEQFVRQARAGAAAPDATVEAFAIVQPPERAIARWVAEGRFQTAEARALFPLTPADQSAMLIAAGAKARALADQGFEVAILAEGDIACVIAGRRDCARDGRAAAARAKIVFVPRIDLDAASAALKGRSEALLYTEFRKVDGTADWDIWVRRGELLPSTVALSF